MLILINGRIDKNFINTLELFNNFEIFSSVSLLLKHDVNLLFQYIFNLSYADNNC